MTKKRIEEKAAKDMRIVFLGTPDFAVPVLTMLCENGYNVVGVFTQPDKAVGRSKKLQPPPVKEVALQYGIPVYQCERIKERENAEILESLKPDLMITAAFGQILSQQNIDSARIGCINVHGSLLPKYRGAAPIQWAIIDGETTTGVTTMMTDVGLDTGDILYKKEIAIDASQTAGELFEKLAQLGAITLQETLDLLIEGNLYREKQDEQQATKCGKLTKEIGRIEWLRSAQEIHNLVRGTNPWPGAYTTLHDDIIKIWATTIADVADEQKITAQAGEILVADRKQGILIACGDGSVIEILELQMPNSKRMDAKSYLNGKTLPVGDVFV